MIRRSRLAVRPRLESLEIRAVLSTANPVASALSPSELDTAYGLNAATIKSGSTTTSLNGSGETIAIIDVDNDPNIAKELATFDAKYNLPTPSLTVDDLAGSTTNSGWEEEEALDVEWSHASAPGANIVLVEAASSSTQGLLAGVNAAKAIPAVSVISMSWGTSEFAGETADDSTFTTPSGHIGITYLASAGDEGAGAEWPASSPNVIGVGGTSLILTSSGAISSQSAWTDSGGGTSRYETEPTYQDGVESTGRRDTPDVSLDANPNTGVSVYSSAGGGWIQVGGTSLGSPVWAGLIAVADEGRALEGKGTLNGATQTLPDLYAASTSSFTDITSGSRATSGYDTSTGLGTPNAATLVANLVADPTTGAAPETATSVGISTTTSTGSTSSTTTTTTTTPPSAPRFPRGGWWTSGGFYGYATSAPQNSFSGPSTTKNSGQVADKSSTPHAAVKSASAWTVEGSSKSAAAAKRSVDLVITQWKRSALA